MVCATEEGLTVHLSNTVKSISDWASFVCYNIREFILVIKSLKYEVYIHNI
jgi:hypothetical protein